MVFIPHHDIQHCKFYLCLSLFCLTFNVIDFFLMLSWTFYQPLLYFFCKCTENVYLRYLSSDWHKLLSTFIERLCYVLKILYINSVYTSASQLLLLLLFCLGNKEGYIWRLKSSLLLILWNEICWLLPFRNVYCHMQYS